MRTKPIFASDHCRFCSLSFHGLADYAPKIIYARSVDGVNSQQVHELRHLINEHIENCEEAHFAAAKAYADLKTDSAKAEADAEQQSAFTRRTASRLPTISIPERPKPATRQKKQQQAKPLKPSKRTYVPDSQEDEDAVELTAGSRSFIDTTSSTGSKANKRVKLA